MLIAYKNDLKKKKYVSQTCATNMQKVCSTYVKSTQKTCNKDATNMQHIRSLAKVVKQVYPKTCNTATTSLQKFANKLQRNMPPICIKDARSTNKIHKACKTFAKSMQHTFGNCCVTFRYFSRTIHKQLIVVFSI